MSARERPHDEKEQRERKHARDRRAGRETEQRRIAAAARDDRETRAEHDQHQRFIFFDRERDRDEERARAPRRASTAQASHAIAAGAKPFSWKSVNVTPTSGG